MLQKVILMALHKERMSDIATQEKHSMVLLGGNLQCELGLEYSHRDDIDDLHLVRSDDEKHCWCC